MEKAIVTSRYPSPAGDLIIGSLGHRLCLCDWSENRRGGAMARRLEKAFGADIQKGSSDVIDKAVSQLDEYFSGHRKQFDMPIAMSGSPFQMLVWRTLRQIPYGSVISYGEEARRIGNPAAVRAVAMANSFNPISIFVPCHRVIGSDGTLTGYGGGLDAKLRLLQLEASNQGLFAD